MQQPMQTERRHFTVAEVQQMLGSGILNENEPLELVDGELIVVPPQGPIHSAMLTEVQQLLTSMLATGTHIRLQCPIHADEQSAPEPDLAVVDGSPRVSRAASGR